MSTSVSSPVPSRQQIVELVFRHKFKVVLIPLLSLLAGAAVIFYMPRTYHSEAVLFLQVGRETVGIDPTAAQGQMISLQQSGRDDEVKSAINVFASRGVISRAVDRLGVDVVLGRDASVAGDPPHPAVAAIQNGIGAVAGWFQSIDPISDRERAIIEISESLSFETERGSTVIGLEMEAESAELAQKILETLIEVFQEEHARIYRNQNSLEFFAEQSSLLQQQLTDAKQAVLDAKNASSVGSVTRRGETLEGELLAIENERHLTEQQIATASAQVASLRKELASLSPRVATTTTTVPNDGADLLRQDLYALEIQRAERRARYSDDHPLVQAIEQQVEEAEKVVAAQGEQRQLTVDDVNPIYQELELELKKNENLLAGHESRLATLDTQRERLLQEIRDLNEHETLVNALEREVVLAEKKFFKYAENYEQARIDQELQAQQISNISISQPPMLLEKPISPSKPLVVLASLFMATVGTAAAVLASGRLNDRLEDESQLENLLPLPVLAIVPQSTRLTQRNAVHV